ncbi:MAG: glycoside hydrolase family 5 protein [Candidatus Omnitrophica bacterium]|nr:glycoside hydrolase family 5 protein [Candidatus Omnitrophota bacterium]
MNNFLKTRGTEIIGTNGKPIILKGVNVGGWLMMEAYIMCAPNFPEHLFKQRFQKTLGTAALKDFEKLFRENFITEKDFANIARQGFNCVRVPFNCRLVEDRPYHYAKSGLERLDTVLSWARKYKIYVILDLHAAIGAQNHDWHGDSAGEAKLWTTGSYQKRTLALWKLLANRYKDERWLAGYDLLNESVLDNTKLLNRFYKQVIKTIRSVDRNHILFIEGNKWATDIECLDCFDDDNYVLSIHSYEPLDITFNFVPFLKYPTKQKNRVHNAVQIKKHLSKYHKISQERNVPVFLGEFGVNYREGHCGEDLWLNDMLKSIKAFGFHWTYWTYKSFKNGYFPDGIYSYYENPVWVNRCGPLSGWDTYHLHWKKHKSDIVRSWRTDQFRENTKVLKLLKQYAK